MRLVKPSGLSFFLAKYVLTWFRIILTSCCFPLSKTKVAAWISRSAHTHEAHEAIFLEKQFNSMPEKIDSRFVVKRGLLDCTPETA